MEKIIIVILIISLYSCGNPVDSDDNIVKDKIENENMARPTFLNSTWEYDIDARYTVNGSDNLPPGYPTNISEIIIRKNESKGNDWYLSNISGNEVNVQINDSLIHYEKDEFEKLIYILGNQSPLYIKVNSTKDWFYHGVSYFYKGESELTINGTTYKVKSVSFNNPFVDLTGNELMKKIYYNKEFGIIRIEYNYVSFSRSTFFDLNLNLIKYSK